MTKHSPLHRMLIAYLDEDWPDEFGTWEAAVDQFVADEPSSAADAADEAEALAAENEESVIEYLAQIHCAYEPSPEAARLWMSRVSDRLRRSSA